MSDIFPVQKQRIFGSEAPLNQMGVIGSGNLNEQAHSKDIEVIQSKDKYLLGYMAITQDFNNSDLPFSEELNSLFYMITRQLAYLQRAGISEWKETIEYYDGSFVRHGGKIYQALKNLPGEGFTTSPAPGTNEAANSWAEIDQIRNLQDGLQRAQDALGTRITNLETSLKREIAGRVPDGMVYIQHKNESTPYALFGGTWTVVNLDLQSYMLRYEGGGLSAFGNRYLTRNLTVERYSFSEGLTTAKFPNQDYWNYFDAGAETPLVKSVSGPTEVDLNQLGQTIKLWKKISD